MKTGNTDLISAFYRPEIRDFSPNSGFFKIYPEFIPKFGIILEFSGESAFRHWLGLGTNPLIRFLKLFSSLTSVPCCDLCRLSCWQRRSVQSAKLSEIFWVSLDLSG